MNNIEWKGGAVCYAYGKQWFVRNNQDNDLISLEGNGFASSANVIMRKDFQLNEIRTGDFIPSSELDTEQKYNEVVEVFGLFGFKLNKGQNYSYKRFISASGHDSLMLFEGKMIWQCRKSENVGLRKLTYHQIIAIGKLKRMMLEREKCNNSGFHNGSVSNVNRDIERDVNKPEHLKDGNKYHKTLIGLCGTPVVTDIYRVLDAYDTGSSSIDHAVKKLLNAGNRGHKDKLTDYENAIESIEEAIKLEKQKAGLK